MSASEQPIVHTPGPWEVREVDGLFAIAHPNGWVLESSNEQQNRVDANLIAVAPNLLAALRGLLDSFEAYSALNKPENEWDEYDYMMFPRWKAAKSLVEKVV